MKSSKLSHFLLKAIPTLVCLLFLIPLVTLAQENGPQTLVKFPGINAGDTNFGNYVNSLYKLSITVASLLAVVKLIGAGAKYVMSDIVTSKESAKADIKNAIIGLLIILAAVTILTEINPKLNNFGIVGQAVDVSGSYKNTTTVSPCVADPTKLGCGKTSNLTYEELQKLKKACESKGGVVNISAVGSYCDEGKKEPETNFAWEETDTNIIKFFNKRCEGQSCKVIFVAKTSGSFAEQESFCVSKGGEMDSGSYSDGTPGSGTINYNYCIK